ncbi:hypothetical protein LJC49_00440 [Ruminococcaceae bacterium OttesenSCG-928-I18]|nr:hypothetical protein [Ruminococcaceae bacterium OttesenSCG-928-I18]
MSFQSVHFLLFLPLVAGAYFVLPAGFRRFWLLLASYYFYFFAAPKYLPVLLCGTVFSYIAAWRIDVASSRRGKRGWLAFGVAGLVLALSFFKYNGLYARLLVPLFAAMGMDYSGDYFVTAAALGISFYTFMALGYLIDLYRGDVPREKSLLGHALFLGFFPAITSGPISRAGDLMPQLRDTSRRFSAQGWADGLRLMAVGFFKKLAVADTLALFVNAVYRDLLSYSGLTLTLAAVGYALQLYFDFSGYTDIALGAAALFGIKLRQNFNTPYFATNFSGFWARWHITLSTWLQDYIFTPLVWSRWTEKIPFLGRKVTKPPVLSSLAVVFLVSGLWHGDTLCFLFWGALMALYRIGEELLHRWVGKPKKHPSALVRAGKTAVVFLLWVESLVFFRIGTPDVSGSVIDAFSAIGRQFRPWSLTQTGTDLFEAVAEGFYGKGFMVALFLVFSLFCLALALWADWMQCFRLGGKHPAEGLKLLHPAVRWAFYFVLVLCCFAGFIAGSGGFGGTNFLYGGF